MVKRAQGERGCTWKEIRTQAPLIHHMSQIKKDLNSFKVLLKAFNLKTMPENEGYMSSYLENLRNANIIFMKTELKDQTLNEHWSEFSSF